jgi:hypothetical protein
LTGLAERNEFCSGDCLEMMGEIFLNSSSFNLQEPPIDWEIFFQSTTVFFEIAFVLSRSELRSQSQQIADFFECMSIVTESNLVEPKEEELTKFKVQETIVMKKLADLLIVLLKIFQCKLITPFSLAWTY